MEKKINPIAERSKQWMMEAMISLLKNNDLLCHLIEVSNRYWEAIYERFQKYWKNHTSETELEYCLLFNMGGLWNILMKWLYSETRNTSLP